MTALAVKALCKSFGGLSVTRDVHLGVEPGEQGLGAFSALAQNTSTLVETIAAIRPSACSGRIRQVRGNAFISWFGIVLVFNLPR